MKQRDFNKIIVLLKNFELSKYKKTKRIIIDLALIAIGILWVVIIGSFFNNDTKTYKADFAQCIDGDTIKLIVDYKVESVRLLAIDTPEIGSNPDYYGLEASEYTCNLVSKAKVIKIELDGNASKYDKYGRLLGWIFIDDVLLQESLVKNGYAKVAYLYDDYKYTDDIKKLETDAKEKQLGIWNLESSK